MTDKTALKIAVFCRVAHDAHYLDDFRLRICDIHTLAVGYAKWHIISG